MTTQTLRKTPTLTFAMWGISPKTFNLTPDLTTYNKLSTLVHFIASLTTQLVFCAFTFSLLYLKVR